MKAAVKQSAMPTSPTANQDFTDAVFSSDVKLMIPFFSRAVANNTVTSQAGLSFGATDGTAAASISEHAEDNLVTTADSDDRASATTVTCMADTTNASIAEGTGSFLSNGGRIAWADWNANELINVILIGGSDVSVTVVSGTLNGTTNVPITHGLGATPDVIIGFTINRDASANGPQVNHSIGFYDVVGTTYASVTDRCSNATTTAFSQIINTDCITSQIQVNGTIDFEVTINTVGETTFNMVASAATPNAPTTAPVVYFVCLKVTGGSYKVGTFATKTSTGTQADISGMAAKPKAVLYLPTFLTALDTASIATTCESTGIGAAADNEGATEQACSSRWGNDAVVLGNPTPTTDTNSYTSNTKAGMIFDGAGALGVDWSISSWDSGGVTHNYSTADATGRYVGYLAIAPAAATGKRGRLSLMGVG